MQCRTVGHCRNILSDTVGRTCRTVGPGLNGEPLPAAPRICASPVPATPRRSTPAGQHNPNVGAKKTMTQFLTININSYTARIFHILMCTFCTATMVFCAVSKIFDSGGGTVDHRTHGFGATNISANSNILSILSTEPPHIPYQYLERFTKPYFWTSLTGLSGPEAIHSVRGERTNARR